MHGANLKRTEPISENRDVHFLLKYHGIQFKNIFINNELERMPVLERFVFLYSNLGALVMRYNLTFSQRASALQQLVEPDYSKHPVESYAQGDDETSLFNCPKTTSDFENDERNYYLVANAHQCIGRSQVSNERMQRLVRHNKKRTHGEQKLWDIMHCPVWTVGIEFHSQLNKQGFVYISCPPGTSKTDRKLMDGLLRQGNFKTVFEQGLKWIECHDGQKFQVVRLDQINLFLDHKRLYTQEDNQFSIDSGEAEVRSPLGWILYENEKAILPQWCTEDIVKLSVLKKMGVNALDNEQKRLLFSGSLADGPLISWKENRAFNCIYNILLVLEKYHFDPNTLLNASKINGLLSRFEEALQNEPDLIDDFLTGAIQQEMIQPLIKSRPKSTREEVPQRFTDSFEISSNTMRALAYAFDIKDEEGHPIVRDVTVEPSNQDDDVLVKGHLASPSFNSGNHVATLLSTAILISEQMILEQLVKEAYLDCLTNPTLTIDHPLKQFLATISMHAEDLWYELLQLATCSPKEGIPAAPILGIRYAYCHNTLKLFREHTGFKQLIDLCEKFSPPEVHTDEVLTRLNEEERYNLQRGLKHLYLVGDYLQTNKTTAVQKEGSRGINAGLMVLIPKIAPQLCDELNIPFTYDCYAKVKPRDKQKVHDRVTMEIIRRCPFSKGQHYEGSPATLEHQSITGHLSENQESLID